MQETVVHASPTKLLQALRAVNFLTALLLGAGGVFVFIPLPTTIDPITIISGLYVIFFALMLCCFECHLSRFDVAVAKYFGFMFTWQGRCLFFLFVGLLSFGLSWVGVAAGIASILAVLFNVYVLKFNAASRAAIERQQNELRVRAVAAQSQSVSIDMAQLGKDAAAASTGQS